MQLSILFRGFVVGALGALAGGCALLPGSGPITGAVEERAAATAPANHSDRLQYALIEITPEVLRVLPGPEPRAFAGRFTDRRPAPLVTLGVGDVVTVAIFEASAGGLFIPAEAGARSGNFVTLPAQEVDRQGNISIPFAGIIPAAGRTIRQVQDIIQERLRNRAIEPQAVVTLNERRSTQVTVLGDVGGAQKLNLNPLGERVLDVIARAGGTRFPGHEMLVTLQRGRERATVNFNRLLQSPADNVFVQPGDTLYLFRQAQSFLAFGGTSNQGLFQFDKENLTLAEAVARVGGLIDARSDPDVVLLYRVEERHFLERIGVDMSRLPHGPRVPVIYRARLRDPSGFFLTSTFQVRDRDIIYVANSTATEWQKFTAFINNNINFATNIGTIPTIGRSGSTTILRTTGTGVGP